MEEHYENIINVYVAYYNKRENTNMHMFSGISTMDDSNPIMDEFFVHMDEFNESDEMRKRIYNPSEINTAEYEELYAVCVEGSIVCISELLIPIIIFISTNVDWRNKKWNIVHIENE
jgi:hypothetical protein